MHTLLTLGLWLVGGYVALRVLTRGLVAHRLTRLRAESAAPTPLDALPPGYDAVLGPAADLLEALGFEPIGAVREPELLGGGAGQVYLELQHRERPDVWARLTLAPFADPRRPVQPELWCADGEVLRTFTLDVENVVGVDVPGYALVVLSAASLGDLWEQVRASLPAPGPALAREALHARSVAIGDAMLEALRAKGHLEERSDGSVHLSLRGAFAMAPRVQRSNQRRQRALAAIESREEVPLEVELAEHGRSRESLSGEPYRGTWLALSAVTLIAFVASFAGLFDPATAIALTAVVALHEAGHYLAMRALGYRDTRVYFIPFLGAATIGQSERTAAWKQVVVLLAGPLPGIALGVLIALLAPTSWRGPALEEAVLWLIGLNLLNLVPVPPLDGGKVLQLLISGMPRLGLLLGLASALIFGAGALATADGVLIVLAVVVTLGLATSYRAGVVESAVRAAGVGPEHPLVEQRRHILAQLRERMPERFGQARWGLAEQVERRLKNDVPSVAFRWVVGLFYAALFFGATGVGAVAVWASMSEEAIKDATAGWPVTPAEPVACDGGREPGAGPVAVSCVAPSPEAAEELASELRAAMAATSVLPTCGLSTPAIDPDALRARHTLGRVLERTPAPADPSGWIDATEYLEAGERTLGEAAAALEAEPIESDAIVLRLLQERPAGWREAVYERIGCTADASLPLHALKVRGTELRALTFLSPTLGYAPLVQVMCARGCTQLAAQRGEDLSVFTE